MSVNAEKTYQCGCGVWWGEKCAWSGPLSEMVVVEWMPEYLRATHSASGNRGSYPLNRSERVAVEKGCAQLHLKSDSEWSRIVPESPDKYADESD